MCETETTTKPEVVAQLINEMMALIQEIKTIRAVTEKLPAKKDTNIKIATNQEKQTKNKENPKAPITGVDSITRPPQTSPKRDTTKNSPPDKQGHGPKLGKNKFRSRSRTTPTKNSFEASETMEIEYETPHQDKIQFFKKNKKKYPLNKLPKN